MASRFLDFLRKCFLMKDVKSCLYLPLNMFLRFMWMVWNDVNIFPSNSQLSHCPDLKQHGAYYFIQHLSIPVPITKLKITMVLYFIGYSKWSWFFISIFSAIFVHFCFPVDAITSSPLNQFDRLTAFSMPSLRHTDWCSLLRALFCSHQLSVCTKAGVFVPKLIYVSCNVL